MRRVLVAAAAAAFVLGGSSAHAQFSIPGLNRGDREVVSVLGQVRNGDFNERCSNPVGEVEGEALEAYDLVDMLVGAPDGVRYNVNYAASERADTRLYGMLQRFKDVQAPPSGINVTVNVEDTADIDARQSNAGRILITMGLMNALRDRPELSEEQRTADLAFILGHEYAHVLLCHYNRSVTVSRNRRALRTASALGLLAVAVSNSSVTQTAAGTTVNMDGNAAGEDYLAVMAGLTVLRTFNSSVVNPAWSRQQERDADRLAIELMAEAGYPTDYVENLLTALHAADEETTSSFTQLAARLPTQTVNAFALSLGQQDQRRSFRDMLTVSVAGAGLQAFQQWRTNQLRHFHDPVDRRMNWINPMLTLRAEQQGERDLALLAERSQENQSWDEGLYEDLDADQRAPMLAEQAQQLFAESNYEGGCAAATQALAADRANLDAQMACGQCEIHRENITRAARHLDAVQQSQFAGPAVFENIVTIWSEARQRQRAEASLNAGAARFPERFYVPRMYMHARFEEHDQVQATAAACAAADIPNDIKSECARTARELTPQPTQPEAAPGTTTATPSILNPFNALVPGRR